jgi:hypothetical protein
MTDDYVLSYGTHAAPQDGRCAMEWVSHLAGEPHSDSPACVSPVLRAMCIALNDALDHEPRQRLRPYLARTIGTAGDGHDAQRGWQAMDWLIRDYAPTWLRLADRTSAADELTGLAAIADAGTLQAAMQPLTRARLQARAARRRTYGSRSPSGWAAAVAAGLTGREAAWSCTGAAAWAAARLSIGDAHGDQARAAVRTTAGDAAAVAVRRHRAEHRHDGVTARELARRALAPTLQALTDSAIDLLDRMLPTEHLPLGELVPRLAPGPARPQPAAGLSTGVISRRSPGRSAPPW